MGTGYYKKCIHYDESKIPHPRDFTRIAQDVLLEGYGTDGEGKAFELAWSGAEDGSMHPTLENGEKTNTDQGVTKAQGLIHRLGKYPDGTFESTLTVSSDGKTLTDEINDTKAGKEKHVYRRVK